MRAYSRIQVLRHLSPEYVPGSWHKGAQRKLAAKSASLGIESWVQVLFLLLNYFVWNIRGLVMINF